MTRAGVCGWVVDLRQNTGGNLGPMPWGWGPCLREGEARSIRLPRRPAGRRLVPRRSSRVRRLHATASALAVSSLRGGHAGRACCLGPLPPAPPRCWRLRCAVAPRRARSARSTRGLSAGNRTFLVGRRRLAGPDGCGNERCGRTRIRLVRFLPDVAGRTGSASAGQMGAADTVLDAAVAWLDYG